jgi:hypothetical protein
LPTNGAAVPTGPQGAYEIKHDGSEHLDGADGEIVFRHACKLGLEGTVAKRGQAVSVRGSPDWVKVKNPDVPAATRIMERLSDRSSIIS